jgi:beta-lactam-binding protein with PASTA domain/predicted Ser/Thr protein kinase
MRLEEGQVVDGRYRLVGRLGSGGMADVWLADDQMLDRQVALKFLHERFNQDQQFVERFRREASSAAGLSHQNVVGVYDRGDWDGRHYIAMEYVEGASLKDLITRGLTVGEAVEIVRQILSGARFAHERGIVHRDLKPQNVMVDSDGRARVTDFGIARAGASEITQTGSVLGTAQYLSPEQAQGLDVTATADIYSIGVILYEALTGRVPFEADTPVAVALKQISERPRPPSELNPAVPPALDAVVLRALAKDPANRFASAAEFLQALDAAEADPSGGALGDTAAYGAAAAAGVGLGTAAAAEQAAAAERAAAEQEAALQEPGWRRWLHGWRLAVVIAVILLLALGGVLLYALTRPDQVTVPRVTGVSLGEAKSLLEDRGFEADPRRFPNCADPGTVVEQDPAALDKADEGSTVTLIVSRGMTVKVPKVRGLAAPKAAKKLKGEQLLAKEKQIFSKAIDPGNAIKTEPPTGTEVDCHEAVTLFVSRGQDLVTVPDVVGLQEDEARSQLEGKGFIVNIEQSPSDQPEGQVLSEDPGAGSTIPRGKTVKLTVSGGPPQAVVPNVIGASEDSAVASIQARGFNVRERFRDTDQESEDGDVVDQAPPAGTRLDQGETVTIFVGRFVEPTTTTSTSSTSTNTDTTGPKR